MSNDSGLVPSSTPGPSSDTPITLPSGTVVRVRNLVIFKKLGGPNALTIYIETPTLEADGAQLAREAQELVTMHDTSPSRKASPRSRSRSAERGNAASFGRRRASITGSLVRRMAAG